MKLLLLMSLLCFSAMVQSTEKDKWFSIGVGVNSLKINSDISSDLRDHSVYFGPSVGISIAPVEYVSFFMKRTDYSLLSRIVHELNFLEDAFDSADGEDDEKPVNIRSNSIGLSLRVPLKKNSHVGLLFEEHRWKISDRDDDPSPGVDNIDIFAKGKTTAHGLEYLYSHERVSFNLGAKVFRRKPFEHSFFANANFKF